MLLCVLGLILVYSQTLGEGLLNMNTRLMQGDFAQKYKMTQGKPEKMFKVALL